MAFILNLLMTSLILVARFRFVRVAADFNSSKPERREFAVGSRGLLRRQVARTITCDGAKGKAQEVTRGGGSHLRATPSP